MYLPWLKSLHGSEVLYFNHLTFSSSPFYPLPSLFCLTSFPPYPQFISSLLSQDSFHDLMPSIHSQVLFKMHIHPMIPFCWTLTGLIWGQHDVSSYVLDCTISAVFLFSLQAFLQPVSLAWKTLPPPSPLD